jgi:hypothetical protein
VRAGEPDAGGISWIVHDLLFQNFRTLIPP